MLKHLAITESADATYLAKLHLKLHPNEDAWSRSKDLPIFVVADGVTLEQLLIEGKPYPNPSPAGEAARIFCDTAIQMAEASYGEPGIDVVKKAFEAGNQAVAEYNRSQGRTKDTTDYWLNDLYAATAALVVVKDHQVYWGTVCDSYVMHFGVNGRQLFKSPLCHSLREAEPPPFTDNKEDKKAWQQYIWGVRRNGLNDQGQRIGYGVVTGEPATLKYLSTGSFKADKGELMALLTDGFDKYLELPEFMALFKHWPKDLEVQVKQFTALRAKSDPDKFGHERTLIILK